MNVVLILYYIFINLLAVTVTITDKIKAVRRKWRIKESTLLIISVLGGSVAMLMTMLVIKHKTRHLKFMLGIPVIILLQAIIVYFVWRFFYA